MTDPGRQYSDREMAMILRLATDLEARGRRALPSGSGRTLAEIEDIAAGAGIAPETIRAAAAALREDQQGVLARFLSGPTTFRQERVIPGDLDDAQLRALVDSIRWELATEVGDTTTLPDGVAWRHKTEEGPLTQVEAVSRAGITRLRLLGKYDDPATWVLLGTGFSTAIVAGLGIATLDPSVAGFTAVIGGAGTASWIGARAFWRRWTSRVQRRHTHLMDRLEAQAREMAESPEQAES
jgi:hypothetical protein